MADLVHYPTPEGLKAPPLSAAVKAGNLLFVSGIPGFGHDWSLPPEFAAQFHNVVSNLNSVLRQTGGENGRIVKINVLLTRAEDVEPMNRLYAAAFGPAPYPARTCSIVAGLPHPDMMIELECVVAV